MRRTDSEIALPKPARAEVGFHAAIQMSPFRLTSEKAQDEDALEEAQLKLIRRP